MTVGSIGARIVQSRLLVDAAASVSAKRKTIVFLGDYIDRGPESQLVVDLLCGALPTGFYARFLKGNHEEMLLKFLEYPPVIEAWRINGGAATLESYGVDVQGLRRNAAKPDVWQRSLLAVLPERHRRFFEDLELSASFGDYLFVHAGVRPGLPIDKQNPKDLLWIRKEFLYSKQSFGKVVVHGHTPTDAPETRANRIGIDTGAYVNNRLTALRLQDGSRRFLTAEAGRTALGCR